MFDMGFNFLLDYCSSLLSKIAMFNNKTVIYNDKVHSWMNIVCYLFGMDVETASSIGAFCEPISG